MKVKKQRIILFYILVELLLINLSFFAVSKIKYDTFFRDGYSLLLLIYNLSWVAVVFINGSQDRYMRLNTIKRIKDQFSSLLLFLGVSSPLVLLVEQDNYSRTMIFGTMLAFFALDFLVFGIANRLVKAGKGQSFGSRLLILGAEKNGKQLLDFTKKNGHLGYNVIGFLDDQKVGNNGVNVIGKVDDLSKVLEENYVDEIIITLPMSQEGKIKTAIKTADDKGVRVNLVPDFLKVFDKGYRAYNINTLPIIETRSIALDDFSNFVLKKVFDMLFALTVLILLSPVLLTIAILIKLNSKGPVFYKPIRKGLKGNDFVCFKFRSMYVDNTAGAGTKSTVKDDPRITRIGKFMRKYDIDELPQFINVLKGDMSVVGPRPHRVNLNDELSKVVNRYMIRHYVKPGLTGWAQVNGWRGPTETEEQKTQRIKHDLWYIENWSFWLDIKIIFLTVFGRKTRVNAF